MSIVNKVLNKQDTREMTRNALEVIIQLYNDKTHFIYELLQNAEDSNAKDVKFIQYNDRLELLHNGDSFTEDDLAGLCDIAQSTKKDDVNKIGKFGVGFKSVFSICETVKVFSHPIKNGYDQFAVEVIDFTRPQEIEDEDIPEGYTTKFVFPYAVRTEQKKFLGYRSIFDINKNIQKALTSLGIDTLLFLKKIQKIHYSIQLDDFQKDGSYELKKKKLDKFCTLIKASDNLETDKNEEPISYLMFSRKIDSIIKGKTVDIAYSVYIDEKGEYNFRRTNFPYVFLYFPTGKESKLPFVIQGPYVTTPNRGDVVENDDENEKIVDETIKLYKETIDYFRESGKLNYSLLNILPFNEDTFRFTTLLHPFCDVTQQMYREDNMYKTTDGTYVNASKVRMARNRELLNLFDDATLSKLCEQEYHWLPDNITENGTEFKNLHCFLRDRINIPVDRPEYFKYFYNKNLDFLPSMDEEWLHQFYDLYGEIKNAYGNGKDSMKSAKIVRTNDGQFIAAYEEVQEQNQKFSFRLNVYLLPRNGITNSKFKFVDPIFSNRHPSLFKEALLLHEPDPYSYFIDSIRSRYSSPSAIEKISTQDHLKDVKELIKYADDDNHKEEIESIIRHHFALKCDVNGSIRYLPPFGNTIYYKISDEGIDVATLYKGVKQKIFLDEQTYFNAGISKDNLKIFQIKRKIQFEAHTYLRPLGNFKPGLNIEGIEDVIDFIKKDYSGAQEKSKIIFRYLQENEAYLQGSYYTNFSTSEEEGVSLIVENLKNEKWLYSKKGFLSKPIEITRDELDDKLYGMVNRSSRLYEILGFKVSTEEKLEKNKKIIANWSDEEKDLVLNDILKNKYGIENFNILDYKDYIGSLERNDQDDYNEADDEDFPSSDVKDFERLKNHAAATLWSADDVRYEKILRSIRVTKKSPREYIENMYSSLDNVHCFCQMCHTKVEKIHCLQLYNTPKYELSALNVCLCPNCADKFVTLRNNDNFVRSAIRKICTLTNEQINMGKPVAIAYGKEELWFKQTHISEIRDLLNFMDEDITSSKKEPTSSESAMLLKNSGFGGKL